MKELAEAFEGQFTCLGENTEIHITFYNELIVQDFHAKGIHKIKCK